jgi:hypothetical protein
MKTEPKVTEIEKARLVDAVRIVPELHDFARRLCADHDRLKEEKSAALGALNDAVDEIRRLQALVGGDLDGDLDLDLLGKFADGEGGRRTGALRRAGLLEWTVTPRGLAALGLDAKPGK